MSSTNHEQVAEVPAAAGTKKTGAIKKVATKKTAVKKAGGAGGVKIPTTGALVNAAHRAAIKASKDLAAGKAGGFAAASEAASKAAIKAIFDAASKAAIKAIKALKADEARGAGGVEISNTGALVIAAIQELNERKGSSAAAIKKFVAQKSGRELTAAFNSTVNKNLGKMMKAGQLISGAPAGRKGAGCFKLAPEEKQRLASNAKAQVKIRDDFEKIGKAGAKKAGIKKKATKAGQKVVKKVGVSAGKKGAKAGARMAASAKKSVGVKKTVADKKNVGAKKPAGLKKVGAAGAKS